MIPIGGTSQYLLGGTGDEVFFSVRQDIYFRNSRWHSVLV